MAEGADVEPAVLAHRLRGAVHQPGRGHGRPGPDLDLRGGRRHVPLHRHDRPGEEGGGNWTVMVVVLVVVVVVMTTRSRPGSSRCPPACSSTSP